MFYFWTPWQRPSAVGREEGQGMVEYALIIALIAVLLIAVLLLTKDQISGTYSTIVSAMAG